MDGEAGRGGYMNNTIENKSYIRKDKSLFDYWNLPKNPNLRENAKKLRKAGVLSEVIFWKHFKDITKLGWDIDRQVIIGNYIVDFFIDELGLVFEIDGASHNEKGDYDVERDKYLETLDLKVVHISDIDVKFNFISVYEFVLLNVKEREKFLLGRIHPVIATQCHPSRGELQLISLLWCISLHLLYL